jgi:hypothetical protein
MDERRSEPRVPIRAEAEVRFSSWEVFKLIYTINISHGGMNLEMSVEPKQGSALTVRLALPSGPPIELEAVVKHVQVTTSTKPQPPGAPPPQRRCEVGVQFKNLDAAKKAAIEQSIRAHGGALGGPIGLIRKKDS